VTAAVEEVVTAAVEEVAPAVLAAEVVLAELEVPAVVAVDRWQRSVALALFQSAASSPTQS